MSSRVSEWPAYVFHRQNGFSDALRASISDMAQRHDLSLADTCRSILCAHYGMDCDLRGPGYSSDRDQGNPKFLLRVQPELWTEIQAEAQSTGRTMKAVVLDTLTAHFS